MDWQNVSDNRIVSIAFVKLEATVPVTDPTYGGAIVLNPGNSPIESAFRGLGLTDTSQVDLVDRVWI